MLDLTPPYISQSSPCQIFECFQKWVFLYEAFSESKYRFAEKKSSKVSYKMLLLSDSTFFKLVFHIFAATTEALILTGQNFCIPSS